MGIRRRNIKTIDPINVDEDPQKGIEKAILFNLINNFALNLEGVEGISVISRIFKEKDSKTPVLILRIRDSVLLTIRKTVFLV